ncbi:hypothetical protein [Streptomyces sp. NPDC023327]|uniref:hypothetical protein n=1 Tax=Streptomyces sp. NPDC023327 TaxID=3157088 RepID=UPI0033DC3A91
MNESLAMNEEGSLRMNEDGPDEAGTAGTYVPPPGPVQIDDPLVAADDEGMDPNETLPPPLDG